MVSSYSVVDLNEIDPTHSRTFALERGVYDARSRLFAVQPR